MMLFCALQNVIVHDIVRESEVPNLNILSLQLFSSNGCYIILDTKTAGVLTFTSTKIGLQISEILLKELKFNPALN